MPHLPPLSPTVAADLRARAHGRLQAQGDAAAATHDATQALRVLFDLASSTETAADALALLHELQVHQIELDMQAQELQRSRQDIENDWDEQSLLQDHAPSAQLVLDAQGQVLSLNATAQAYWPGGSASVVGMPIQVFLSPASQSSWAGLCQSACAEGVPTSEILSVQVPGQDVRAVCASVRPHPAQPGWLVHWLAWPALA